MSGNPNDSAGVAEGSCRQGGQVRRYKDTLKTSLRCLRINPANWEDLAQDRPAWRRTVKTGAAIYKANRITITKAKREARRRQLPQTRSVNAQRTRPAHDVSRRFWHQSVLLGIFERTSAPGRHHQMFPRPHPPRPPRQRSTLTARLNPHCHPPFVGSISAVALTPNTPTNISPITANTRDVNSIPFLLIETKERVLGSGREGGYTIVSPSISISVFTAVAPSPHASAPSVTCESIAQRLPN
nr:unnamed protein product [Spirometra erinaceieuropaei]